MPQSPTYLPAEWHKQYAVQLTWPHEATDWQPILEDVTHCYLNMAREISAREHLIIITPVPARVREKLAQALPQENLERITLHRMPTNDTWARDHGFITLLSPTGPRLLDFRFNGWGEKFAADLDNRICRNMKELGILPGTYEDHLDFVLEGGSIESDGRGTILTTSQCLMAPHRNQPLSQCEIEERLLQWLHADRILWIDHGYLAGDDTDSHIDTLARFCPNDTIAYVQCNDTTDEHFAALRLMEEQLQTFRTVDDRPYRLIPLPMAKPVFDADGYRLPATYANFLIMNNAVLMPTYADAERDNLAQRRLQEAFPGYEIVGIDCCPLIIQHGSLHCCTMQFPCPDLP